MSTKSAKRELVELLAARNSLIVVISQDERMVELSIAGAAEAMGMQFQTWDCAAGFQTLNGNVIDGDALDPEAALVGVMAWSSTTVFVLRDFHPYLDTTNPANVGIIRAIKNMGRVLRNAPEDSFKALVFLSSAMKIPEEIRPETALIRWPLPDRETIAQVLVELEESVQGVALNNEMREMLVDAAIGLSRVQAENALARAVVNGDLSPSAVLQAKRMAVEASGVVRWREPPAGGLEWVGGLDALKDWLKLRRRAFSVEARAFGLPAPKGMLVVGHPGCGKSLIAECCAATWGMPILVMGQIMGSLLGETESNLEKVFEVLKAAGQCILFIDEIEKVFGGVSGSGDTDGGVKKGVFGRFLSWMQDNQNVFVIATSNGVEQLPSELLRKGRFDELWYVELPNVEERVSIFNVQLGLMSMTLPSSDVRAVAEVAKGFSGAEIKAVVVDAMYRAFDSDGVFSASHVMAAISATEPLSKTAVEKTEELRAWAKGRARPATSPTVASPAGAVKSRFAGLSAKSPIDSGN